MDTAARLLAAAAALFLVTWPLALAVGVGWLRERRAQAARVQIALTDALDAALGPVLAPVVRPALWGPWRVELVVPAVRLAVLGRALALADPVLAGAGLRRYRIEVAAVDRPSARRLGPSVLAPAA